LKFFIRNVVTEPGKLSCNVMNIFISPVMLCYVIVIVAVINSHAVEFGLDVDGMK